MTWLLYVDGRKTSQPFGLRGSVCYYYHYNECMLYTDCCILSEYTDKQANNKDMCIEEDVLRFTIYIIFL